MSKIHVVLDEDVLENDSRLKDITQEIIEISNLKGINEKRLHKYGILSGNIDNESSILKIQKIAEVKSVSIDKTRHAI